MATIKYGAKTNQVCLAMTCAPKNHENLSISVKINLIDSFFFTNRRFFLNPTEILKRKLIINICV